MYKHEFLLHAAETVHLYFTLNAKKKNLGNPPMSIGLCFGSPQDFYS